MVPGAVMRGHRAARNGKRVRLIPQIPLVFMAPKTKSLHPKRVLSELPDARWVTSGTCGDDYARSLCHRRSWAVVPQILPLILL